MREVKSRLLAMMGLLMVACGTGGVTKATAPLVSVQRSTLAVSATRAYADGHALVTLSAVARTASSSQIPGVTVEFLVSGTGNGLAAVTARTNASGLASVTLASSVAETKVVSATIDGITLPQQVSIDFVAGPPVELRFLAQPSDVMAGAILGHAVEVEVVDAVGRTVTQESFPVTLSLQGGDAGASLRGALGATTVRGVASFADLWLPRASQGYSLLAESGTIASATSSPFTVTPAAADPVTSSVVATSPSVQAGGSTALTALVRDEFANPVSGEAVSFGVTGTGNEIVQPAGTTDATGHAAGSLGSILAGPRLVTGYLSGARALGGVATVTFEPGPPAQGAGASTLAASPTAGFVDWTGITLTATLKDQFGNPIPGLLLTLAASGGASCTAPAGPTDAAGVATGSVRSSVVGTQTISASVGAAVVATVDVTFAQLQVGPSLSTVMAVPGVAVADGVSSSTVTVTVVDLRGRPHQNAIVEPGWSGAGTILPFSAATDAAGQAVFQVRSMVPTEGMVSATVTSPGPGSTPELLPQGAAVSFAAAHSLGGTVSGLVADGLVLASPGLPDFAVAAGSTSFTFSRPLPEGARYAVTLGRKANGQVCQVTGGVGLVGTTDVTGVAVTCASPDWASITGGWGPTFAFNADGSLWGWGYNGSGQLGAAAPRVVQAPIRLGQRFIAVAGGERHAMAIEPGGSLWAWGANDAGQLGDGTTTDRVDPVPIGAGTVFARVAAGNSHSLAVGSDGSLWAWGDNASGQLGDGTTTSRSTPVPIGQGFTRVAAGDAHSVALKADGTLWAWGTNYSGQVGDGSDFATTRLVPVLVGDGFAEVFAGFDRSAGLKADGTLWAWGSGSVGDGTQGPQRTPFLVGPGFASAALGNDHMCALKVDGTLLAWGFNTYGSVGDGTTTYRTTPVQVATGVAAVAAGVWNTVILKRDGSLWAWGANQLGELGVGTAASLQLMPLQTVPGAGWASVAAGASHSLALTSAQALWSWGYNESGQLGDGTTTGRPLPILVGDGFTTATGGERFSAAVKLDGSLWTWGFNGYGQLGDGSTALTRPVPASIGTGYAGVVAGFVHTAALREDGTVWTFGRNPYGQIGDGTSSNERRTPVKVLDGIARLAASIDLTMALGGEGTLWGWGNIAPASTVPSVRGAPFKAIASGVDHRVAVGADGTLWGWGGNGLGQIGDGSGQATTVPVQIGTGFVAVAAGHYHSLALKTDGTLWAWGANGFSELGDGTQVNRPTPTFIASGVAQFAGGGNHSLAVLSDGTLRAWGRNQGGELGAPWYVLSPVLVR